MNHALPEIQELYDGLVAEKEALLAAAAPNRAEREALLAKIQPLEAELQRIDAEFTEQFRTRLFEVESQIGKIAVMLGGRRLQAEGLTASDVVDGLVAGNEAE